MYDVERVLDRRLPNAKTIDCECGKPILINSNVSIARVGGVVGKVPISIVYVSAPSTNPDPYMRVRTTQRNRRVGFTKWDLVYVLSNPMPWVRNCRVESRP